MKTPFPSCCASLGHTAEHAAFLALLPRIERHGRVYFRHLRCPERKQEILAEMAALGWQWFRQLLRRGKDAARFPAAFAALLARAVAAGRKLAGMDRARDVLSPRARRLKGFAVRPLPQFSTFAGNLLEEALADNMRSEVPAQVAFRLDFPAWARRLCKRDRQVIAALMLGERAGVVARRHGLSPARVSQLRRHFREDWRAFCGEAAS